MAQQNNTNAKYHNGNTHQTKEQKKRAREEYMNQVNPDTGLTNKQQIGIEVAKAGIAFVASLPPLILACMQFNQAKNQQKQMQNDLQNIANAINNLNIK